jgi:ABC-type transport system involved in cytochrome bd biosynthesis fused ATPase/permease subunit
MYHKSLVCHLKIRRLILKCFSGIFNGTVKENITFGKVFQKQLYEAVIFSCALKNDLKSFSGGDQSEIGERGVCLHFFKSPLM